MNPAELFRQESNTVQLAPGDFLFREGEKGEKMYVLLEGEVDIFLGDFVFETAGPGALRWLDSTAPVRGPAGVAPLATA